jgi:hypothetical protein
VGVQFSSIDWTQVVDVPTAVAAIGALTPAADRLAYFTSTSAAALATLTSYARTLLDDADAATARTTLGLGSGNSPSFTGLTLAGALDGATTVTASSWGVFGAASRVGSEALLASGGSAATPGATQVTVGGGVIRAGGQIQAGANSSILLNAGGTQFASDGSLPQGFVALGTNAHTLVLAGSSSTSSLMSGGVVGDAFRRFLLRQDGVMSAGDGTAAAAQCIQVATSTTANDCRLLLWDVTAGSLKRVSRGASDSGGTGFRLLRIAN